VRCSSRSSNKKAEMEVEAEAEADGSGHDARVTTATSTTTMRRSHHFDVQCVTSWPVTSSTHALMAISSAATASIGYVVKLYL